MSFLFHDPYSAWGLRYRANKLPDCPYKYFLLAVSECVEKKYISKSYAHQIVVTARQGTIGLTTALKELREVVCIEKEKDDKKKQTEQTNTQNNP